MRRSPQTLTTDGLDISARKSYPAWFPLPNIISVAASTRGDTRACFSNWGAASTHIAAPGEGIYSTWAFGDASYLSTSGTSMSTPMVSGAVALLAAAKPDATMEQLRWVWVGLAWGWLEHGMAGRWVQRAESSSRHNCQRNCRPTTAARACFHCPPPSRPLAPLPSAGARS